MATTDRNETIHIDARPEGPAGPFAEQRVQGWTVLEQLIDAAGPLRPGRIIIHRAPDRPIEAAAHSGPWKQSDQPPPDPAIVLRTDRLYDPRKLRRAIRSGRDPESAVIWRLDSPGGIAAAEAELVRRQSYQPIGQYWAWPPARTLARWLAPTRIRPNAVTLSAAALMFGSAAWTAFGPASLFGNIAVAACLAIALVLDTADGHLARIQGTASAFGRWLDEVLDESADMLLHAAIAWSAWERSGQPVWLVLGMAYGMGKYLFRVATESSPARGDGGNATEGPPRSTPLRRWVRAIGHADVRWHLWIVLALAGRLELALAAYAVYFPTRAGAIFLGRAVRHAVR